MASLSSNLKVVMCVNHPSRAVSEQAMCWWCLDDIKKIRGYSVRLTEDQKRHKRSAESGTCPIHSGRVTAPGKTVCQECVDRRRRYSTNISGPRRRARKTLVPNEAVDRAIVFKRDNRKCQHCGKHCNGDARADHIIPISLGGPHCYWNFQTLCARCNGFKSNNIRRERRLAHLLHFPIRELIEAFAREQGATLPRGWWILREVLPSK